jgi:hypothetical protein
MIFPMSGLGGKADAVANPAEWLLVAEAVEKVFWDL